MNRRSFLGVAGVAGLGVLAGCSTAVGDVAPPEVPQDALDEGGWEQTDSTTDETVFEEEYGPVTVTGKATTRTYADVELAASVEEKTLGRITDDLAIFSASHINFGPDLNNLPAGVGRKEVLETAEQAARERFAQRMRDAGLENVTQTGEEEFRTDSGKDTTLATFEAEFPVDTLQYEVSGETFTLDVSGIAVAGDLTVWNEGDYVVVAGGAYPAENVAQTTEKELSEAITVTVDIDLGLTPDEYRSEVRGLIAATR